MLYKFIAESFVRADSKEEAENIIKEEVGIDIYEKRITCQEVEDIGQDADYDLIKA